MTGNARGSGYERHENDWYKESRYSIDALLDAEPFIGPIWDPACGGGNIPTACRDRGYEAIGSDIKDRGFGTTGVDFLMSDRRVDKIVSNPPYGIIQPWIERCLQVTTGKVAILARLALLEGKARGAWFPSTPLARVWVHSSRVSMPPGDSDAPAKGGSVAFAWFVFEHGNAGPPTIGWLP
jgi:hypothetical protein